MYSSTYAPKKIWKPEFVEEEMWECMHLVHHKFRILRFVASPESAAAWWVLGWAWEINIMLRQTWQQCLVVITHTLRNSTLIFLSVCLSRRNPHLLWITSRESIFSRSRWNLVVSVVYFLTTKVGLYCSYYWDTSFRSRHCSLNSGRVWVIM